MGGGEVNKVVERTELVPNVHKMVIEAPMLAKKVRPGQFLIVMADEKGERIPISIGDWDEKAGTITIFFLEAGVSTMKLAQKKAGDDLFAVVGPLGHPAKIAKYGTVLLGGGCYGIGGITSIAKAMKAAGNKVIVVIEARSKYLLYNKEVLHNIADEYLETTSDGSSGVRGKVQDVVQFITSQQKVDLAYFIGCTFMMMNCSNATKGRHLKTMVSLNALMLDGTGMCGVCRVSVGGHTKFACVDGPEFDGHQVDWLQMIQRKSMYLQEEMLAYQYHTCRALAKRAQEEGG
jgi:NAD(P)H-flavin reductase